MLLKIVDEKINSQAGGSYTAIYAFHFCFYFRLYPWSGLLCLVIFFFIITINIFSYLDEKIKTMLYAKYQSSASLPMLFP
jgi:hypothetical protein